MTPETETGQQSIPEMTKPGRTFHNHGAWYGRLRGRIRENLNPSQLPATKSVREVLLRLCEIFLNEDDASDSLMKQKIPRWKVRRQ